MSRAEFLAHFEAEPRVATRMDEITFTAAGCWLWPGEGYPRVMPPFAEPNRTYHVHRLSLMLREGRQLGSDEQACHTCDTPRCINPGHLFAGSRSDNAQDAMRKGRWSPPPVLSGETHPQAKLSDRDVVEVLRAVEGGEQIKDVAARLNIGVNTISTWRNGHRRLAAFELWRQEAAS
jgi:hypothetical protein